MIKQYVGARYVPKFYENSLNPLSNEWEENVTYEALTVVTYLKNSYTSKKPVPVTVGNPRNNPEYWSLTGAYNSQVEAYREEVVTFKENIDNEIGDIEDLQTEDKSNLVSAINSLATNERKYVFFSDSYGLSNHGVASYITYLTNDLLPRGTNGFYSFAESGAAFCRVGINYDVEGLINAHLSDITNKNEITDIVLSFGINDRVRDLTSLPTKMSDVNDLLKENFPNATIWLAFMGNQLQKSDSEYVGYLDCIGKYEENAVALGWKWCDGIQYVMHDRRNINTAEDNIHPSQTGSQKLAYAISQILKGNAYKYYARLRTTMTTTESADVIVDQTIDGAITNTWFNNGSLTEDTSNYMGTSGGKAVGTINNSIIDYHMSQKNCIPAFSKANTSGNKYFSCTEYIKNTAEVYHNIYSGASDVEVINNHYWNNHELTVPTILF